VSKETNPGRIVAARLVTGPRTTSEKTASRLEPQSPAWRASRRVVGARIDSIGRRRTDSEKVEAGLRPAVSHPLQRRQVIPIHLVVTGVDVEREETAAGVGIELRENLRS
jgi:hypothetical protein